MQWFRYSWIYTDMLFCCLYQVRLDLPVICALSPLLGKDKDRLSIRSKLSDIVLQTKLTGSDIYASAPILLPQMMQTKLRIHFHTSAEYLMPDVSSKRHKRSCKKWQSHKHPFLYLLLIKSSILVFLKKLRKGKTEVRKDLFGDKNFIFIYDIWEIISTGYHSKFEMSMGWK